MDTTKSDGTVKRQRYCESGTASQLDLFGPTTVNVHVPKEAEVEGRLFGVKAAARGQSLLVFTHTEKTFLLYFHPPELSRVSEGRSCCPQPAGNWIFCSAQSSWPVLDYRLNASLRMLTPSCLNVDWRII